MKANDFRIGNLCYYHVFDKLNEPQEYNVENIIDAEDLRIMSLNEDNSYKPILLTSQWLSKIKGIELYLANTWEFEKRYKIKYDGEKFLIHVNFVLVAEVKYLHDFQNVIYSLTKKELQFK